MGFCFRPSNYSNIRCCCIIMLLLPTLFLYRKYLNILSHVLSMTVTILTLVLKRVIMVSDINSVLKSVIMRHGLRHGKIHISLKDLFFKPNWYKQKDPICDYVHLVSDPSPHTRESSLLNLTSTTYLSFLLKHNDHYEWHDYSSRCELHRRWN